MKKRVAIPVKNAQLCNNLSECSHYEVFEISGENVLRKELRAFAGIDLQNLPGWLKEKGITDVIAYKINPEIINQFASLKINLFVGVSLKSSEKIIEDYIQGRLESDEKIIREITFENNRK